MHFQKDLLLKFIEEKETHLSLYFQTEAIGYGKALDDLVPNKFAMLICLIPRFVNSFNGSMYFDLSGLPLSPTIIDVIFGHHFDFGNLSIVTFLGLLSMMISIKAEYQLNSRLFMSQKNKILNDGRYKFE
jgi:hypothetical protein